MSPRVRVAGFAWLAPSLEAPRDGWFRLPDPERAEVDPGRTDARWPRLDRAARVLALAAHRALGGRALAGESSGVVLGTVLGSLEADERFDATRLQEGGASPLLFPATLASAPAAELSIRHGLQGPIAVVSAGEASFLAAVGLAVRWIETGEATRVLACGLEVPARAAAPLLGGEGPWVESAACFVLEAQTLEAGTLEGAHAETVACATIPASVTTVPASEVGSRDGSRGDPRFLGNAGVPALAAALDRRRDVVLGVRDPRGFAAGLRLAFS